MAISMLSFKLTLKRGDISIQKELLRLIKEHNMAPYYYEVCNYYNNEIDNVLYTEMKTNNERFINGKQEEIEKAKKNGSEDDVLDLLISLVSDFAFSSNK